MQKILFTGTWKLIDKDVEADVRTAVRRVIRRGDIVLTGGATGVDHIALDEALREDPSGAHVMIIIPAYLPDYIHDYHTNWCQHPITKADINVLEKDLRTLQSLRPEHLIEMPYITITQEHYTERNGKEVEIADEVYAFQVNKKFRNTGHNR